MGGCKIRPVSDGFQLRIKLSKMRTVEGEYIDIFPFTKIRGYCLVAALKKQLSLQEAMKRGWPSFINLSGKLMTTEALNRALRILLEDCMYFSRYFITCHSFPSLISQLPTSKFR